MSATVQHHQDRLDRLQADEAAVRETLDQETLSPARRRELEAELGSVHGAATATHYALHSLRSDLARLEPLRDLLGKLEAAAEALAGGADAIGRGEAMSLDLAPLDLQLRDRLQRLLARVSHVEGKVDESTRELEALEAKAEAA